MADATSESEAEGVGPVTRGRADEHARTKLGGASWVILGAGGHARSIADVVTRLGDIVIAVVGQPELAWTVPVIETDDEALDLAVRDGHPVALGIGSNSARATVLARCRARGVSMPAIVAATATVAADSALGLGTVVLEHAHVGPSSRVGDGVIVNTAAIVEHDCAVSNLVHLGPGSTALGGVRIGESAMIGSAACLLPGIIVGAYATVGSGAVAHIDVPERMTVVGVPARVIHSNPTKRGI